MTNPDLTLQTTNGTATAHLKDLIDDTAERLDPLSSRQCCRIINDVKEDIPLNTDGALLASTVSELLRIVVGHSHNSRIRITAKPFSNVVLLHVKGDGWPDFSDVSRALSRLEASAEKLGGFVGFTSYRNKITTLALSFTNGEVRHLIA